MTNQKTDLFFSVKYNYVLFVGTDYAKNLIFRDLLGKDTVKIFSKSSFFRSRILSFLFRFAFSKKVNKHCKILGKSFWFRTIIRQCHFPNKLPLVFIFNQSWHDVSFIIWLQKKYPEIIRILFLDDTIDFCVRNMPHFALSSLKKEYNLILSYNPLDSVRYDLLQTRVYFSRIPLAMLERREKVKLVFVGYAKDRLPLVLSIYDKIKQKVSCNFIIVGSHECYFQGDGLCFIKKEMPYLAYLSYEVASDCILEVIKGDTQGCTYRVWEAVYYNKKLLTNWKGIFTFPYYNPKYMRYFETVEDIDINFLCSEETVDYGYANENSPIHLLNSIDNILDKKYLHSNSIQ